ncbi:MAG TPA: DUF1566 domain-containing protein [Azoarcus taiwanensis]|nr:DUF1566 domain-containing protein [Azoarcus taiwanensis]
MNTTPTLAEGEIHVASIQIAGQAPYYLILLPGDAENLDHEAATAWAAEQGGTLPNRYEQAILFAQQRDQFKRDWYWSDTPHESDEAYAWCQTFDFGTQYDFNRSYHLRARAVRRLPI